MEFSPGSEGCRDRGFLELNDICKTREPNHRVPFCGAVTTQPGSGGGGEEVSPSPGIQCLPFFVRLRTFTSIERAAEWLML